MKKIYKISLILCLMLMSQASVLRGFNNPAPLAGNSTSYQVKFSGDVSGNERGRRLYDLEKKINILFAKKVLALYSGFSLSCLFSFVLINKVYRDSQRDFFTLGKLGAVGIAAAGCWRLALNYGYESREKDEEKKYLLFPVEGKTV